MYILKKSIVLSVSVLLTLLFSTTSLYADVLVEAKAAYFRPTDSTFRKIYSGGGIYGFEVSGKVWQRLYVWGSTNCFYKTGSSLGSDDRTRIMFVPVGLGLKYLFPISFTDLYVGAGILETYLHMHDSSPFVIQSTSKWGTGGILKAGALFNINRYFFIDLFTDYSFIKIGFHNSSHPRVLRHNIDLSGWSFGAGIGYRFGGRPETKKSQTVKR